MEEKKFVKGLGLLESITIVVGSMIGSGIFIVPSIMAGYIQSPKLIILLWIIGGIFTIFGALSYGELSAAMPKAGGQYVFLREAYSPLLGFLFGWTSFLVIQTGLIAAVAVAFAKYFGIFFPFISEHIAVLSMSLFGKIFIVTSAQIVAILSIIILTAINYVGVKAGAFVQNLFTLLKVLAVVALIVLAFVCSKGSFANITTSVSPLIPETIKMGFLAAMAVAISKALFAYDAWNTVTFAAEEVKEPHKNLPIALVFGTGIVTILYVLATTAYFYLLPIHAAAGVAENRIAAVAAQIIFGHVGLYLISAAILISTFGCNNGLILGGARIYYGMAQDKLFFKGAGEIHSKYHVPAKSLIYQCVWASLLTLSGTYSDLLTYATFASILFAAMTVFGLFILRKKSPELDKPFKVKGYPYVPIIYILIALAFLIYVVQGDPVNSGKGLVLILLGLPVYFYWKGKNSRVKGQESSIKK